MLDSKIHVEWLPTAADGVDSQWEMQLYGLVRTDQQEQAIQILLETRCVSRAEAAKQVAKIARDLGIAQRAR